MAARRWKSDEVEALEGAAARLNEAPFDTRRDVAMVFSRIKGEDGQDLPAILEAAARISEGSDVGTLAVGPGDRRAVRTVAAYLMSFGDGEGDKASLRELARAIRGMTSAVAPFPEEDRTRALNAVLQRALHGKGIKPQDRPKGEPAPGTRTGSDGRRTVVLWRPVGPAELELMKEAGMRAFPPRLPDQPIFYPVLTSDYASRLASEWNAVRDGGGFVTRFEVEATVAERYPAQDAGGGELLELWVPAEELEAFNRGIVGEIEVVATYDPVPAGPRP